MFKRGDRGRRVFSALWLGRVAISVGTQSRGPNYANPPWMGFAYGSWFPRFRLSSPGAIPGVFVYWLCFHASVDVWPKGCGNIGLR